MITWIHGLFGAPTDFARVAKGLTSSRPQAAMPLPGHGGAPALDPIDEPGFEELCASFIATLDALEVSQSALIGYSMGARVAMHIAKDYPERVSELVVIGGHPGIEGEDARLGRQMVDRKRAELIRGAGLESFLEGWYKQALFKEFRALPNFKAIVDDRSAGDADAIATTLERLSTGHQAPLAETMRALPIPTLWIAGQKDTRYTALLKPIAEAQPQGRFVEIPGAGHALVSEAPEALSDAINQFFDEDAEERH